MFSHQNYESCATDLTKVADYVTALPVVFSQDVKQERLHVVVQGLVIEEKFGEQAQVLAVCLENVGFIDVMILLACHL